MKNIFEGHTTKDSVTQGLDHLAGLDQCFNFDTIKSPAVKFCHDRILRDIHKASG
jgi:hypothetical protein